jgi:hypothetical protein
MAAIQRDEAHAGPEKKGSEQLGAVIGEQVIRALGRPGGLQKVQVRPLWEDHYRVNVLVGADAASAKVAHSYFVVADGGGALVASTPQIERLY